MNVVTVAYVAVIRDIGTPAASTDAAAAALVPVDDALGGKVELAFDHARILGDAVERVRTDLELTGSATAFLPPAFTLAELRSVYEAVWDVHFDAANFRKRVLADEGWVIPTGKRARPGSSGGKPAELYRAGRRWKQGSPVRRRRGVS
jgi:8-oxo-dGTP diphosphatase